MNGLGGFVAVVLSIDGPTPRRPAATQPSQVLMALVGVFALTAGCTTAPDSHPSGATAPPPGDPNLGDGLEVFLEACRSAVMISAVPAQWADPLIPPGFAPRALGVDAYEVVLRARDCPRAIFDATVHKDLLWMDAGIVVHQELDDESPSQTLLVIATFVANERLATALQRSGIDAYLARIERSVTQVADIGSKLTWNVEGDDYSFAFDVQALGVPGGSLTSDTVAWYPGPPHVRSSVTVRESPELDDDMVIIMMEGDTDMNRLFGRQPAWTFTHSLRVDSEHAYSFRGGYEP